MPGKRETMLLSSSDSLSEPVDAFEALRGANSRLNCRISAMSSSRYEREVQHTVGGLKHAPAILSRRCSLHIERTSNCCERVLFTTSISHEKEVSDASGSAVSVALGSAIQMVLGVESKWSRRGWRL